MSTPNAPSSRTLKRAEARAPRVIARFTNHASRIALLAFILFHYSFSIAALHAGVPEPDNVVYGIIVLGTTPVTAANTSIVVEARRTLTGSAVSSYRMGAIATAGDFYSLRIPLGSGAPVADSNTSLAGETLFLVVKDDSGIRDQASYVVRGRGEIVRVDFGQIDLDHNGLSDEWERRHFGATGVDPNADPDGDSQSNLAELGAGTNPLVVDMRHPADNNPTNNYVSISEITAYGLAWKTGQLWPIAPTTIPVDYVTRAGALWKGGEFYKQDLTASPTAPLWWVNTTPPAPLGLAPGQPSPISRLALGEKPSARRSIQLLAGASQPRVIIAVSPPYNIEAYAIEEKIPDGWDVSEMSGGAAFDEATGKLRWGPFFDQDQRELSYLLTRAAGSESAAQDIVGVGSFDGESIVISGANSVLVGRMIKLQARPAGDGRGVRLTLEGEPGRRYVIQASEDLVNWSEIRQAESDGNGRLEVDESPSRYLRFYRAKEMISSAAGDR